MHWFRLHQPTFITYSLRLAIVESFRWAQFHEIHDQLVLCMHLTRSIKHVYIQMIYVIPAAEDQADTLCAVHRSAKAGLLLQARAAQLEGGSQRQTITPDIRDLLHSRRWSTVD